MTEQERNPDDEVTDSTDSTDSTETETETERHPPIESSEGAAASAEPGAAPEAPAPPPQVVYVPTPQPPKKKGARGVGIGVALASSLIFTIVYALLAVVFIGIGGPSSLADRFSAFAATPSFWLPVIAFILGYVLLVVIVNRAGWWAHVLGGFFVALLVYVVFLGSTVLSANALGAPAAQVQLLLQQQLANPLGWAAAIAAREVPIWVGGLVARRGRTLKARNAEARAAYERELAEARAGGGATPAV